MIVPNWIPTSSPQRQCLSFAPVSRLCPSTQYQGQWLYTLVQIRPHPSLRCKHGSPRRRNPHRSLPLPSERSWSLTLSAVLQVSFRYVLLTISYSLKLINFRIEKLSCVTVQYASTNRHETPCRAVVPRESVGGLTGTSCRVPAGGRTRSWDMLPREQAIFSPCIRSY